MVKQYLYYFYYLHNNGIINTSLYHYCQLYHINMNHILIQNTLSTAYGINNVIITIIIIIL